MGNRITHASLALAAITVVGCTQHATTDVEVERTALTTTTETFSVTTPQGISPANTFLSATNRLQVDDRNTLGTATTLETVANFGSNGLEIGSGGLTNANVYNAAGTTFLRSQAHVRGFVKAAGAISTQEPVTVDGGRFPNSPTTATTTTWTVQWPSTDQGNVFVNPDGQQTLAPGAYGDVTVQSRAKLFLRSGTYFFRSFDSEPQAQILIDKTAGSIFIYVRNQFRFLGPFVENGGPVGRVLVGVLGTLGADLEAGFVGTLVAPNSKISLARPSIGQHKGAWFGHQVEVFSDSTVLHLAFDWSFICPRGDHDGDGVTDCDDACPADPAKSTPGACGCNNPDTDSDGDGIPNCNDCAPSDPTNASCPGGTHVPPPVPPPNVVIVPPPSQTLCTNASALPDPNFLARLTHRITDVLPDEIQSTVTAPTVNETACPQGEQAQDPALCPVLADHVPDERCPTGTCQDCAPNDTACRTSCLPACQACATDADCSSFGAGFACRYAVPSSCATNPGTPRRPECRGPTRRCGLLDTECTNQHVVCDASNSCTCTDVTLCAPPPGQAGPDTPYTTEHKPTATEITSQRQPDPDPNSDYVDPVQGCANPTGEQGNCWCRLTMDDPPLVTVPSASPHHHGGGSVLDLEFNPQVHIDMDLKPLPFGEATLNMDAGVDFLATASIDLGVHGSMNLLDLGVDVAGGRCRFSTTGSRVFVMGRDFVDLGGNEPFNIDDQPLGVIISPPGTVPPPPPPQRPIDIAARACTAAVGSFTAAANRAKKALRDAQQIIRAYQQLPVGSTWDKNQFCTAIGENPPSNNIDPDFPPGVCLTDPIETTIQRYMTYYESRIANLNAAMADVPVKDRAFAAQLSQLGQTINFLNVWRNESQNLLNTTFFVGPVPVNITADILLNYGIRGDMRTRFAPANGLGLPIGALASLNAVSGNLEPAAGATLTMFAGAGFDFGVFAAKAGIQGDLELGQIQADLGSGVGLSMRPSDDPRRIPADLAAIGAGELIYPARQWEYFLDWYYGASLALTDVLRGSINAKVKLKAAFISKTFTKTLLTFDSPFNLPPLQLIDGGNRPSVNSPFPTPGLTANSLGKFEMQLPFVKLQPLTPRPAGTTVVAFPALQSQTHYDGFCIPGPPR
jgi:hypothetical protein